MPSQPRINCHTAKLSARRAEHAAALQSPALDRRVPQYCNRRLFASAQVQRPEAPRPSRSSITMGRSRRGKGAGLQRLRTVEAPKRESTRPRKPSLKAAAQQAASGTSEDDGIVVYSSESDTEMETSSDGEASSPIEVTYRRRPTRRQPAPVKGGGKKKKRRRGDVYDWSKLSVEIGDDDVAELAAVAPDTVVLCRDGVADQSEATHVLEIEGTKYSVHAPPEVILALYDRFVELGPEIEAKVQGRVEIKFMALRASARVVSGSWVVSFSILGWSLSRFWGRSDGLLDDVCDDDLSQQLSTRRSRAVGCTRRRCASPRSSSSSR